MARKPKTIKLAIEALKKQAKDFAFNANLYRRGTVTVATEQAYKRHTEIKDAIAELEGDMFFWRPELLKIITKIEADNDDGWDAWIELKDRLFPEA